MPSIKSLIRLNLLNAMTKRSVTLALASATPQLRASAWVELRLILATLTAQAIKPVG